MTCVVNSRGTYAFSSSSSELLNTIEDVSALTKRLGTFNRWMIWNRYCSIPDFSNSAESKIFKICLDGDVVVGSFDIGWQAILIWIGHND